MIQEVEKAANAKSHEKEVITPEREDLIQTILRANPHLDRGTVVLLTRLSQEDIDRIFPKEEDAPPGYYDVTKPETLESNDMTIDNNPTPIKIVPNNLDMDDIAKEGMVVLEKTPDKED